VSECPRCFLLCLKPHHANRFIGSRGQAERQTDFTMLTVAFRQFRERAQKRWNYIRPCVRHDGVERKWSTAPLTLNLYTKRRWVVSLTSRPL
jgi:hypothetical protein